MLRLGLRLHFPMEKNSIHVQNFESFRKIKSQSLDRLFKIKYAYLSTFDISIRLLSISPPVTHYYAIRSCLCQPL